MSAFTDRIEEAQAHMLTTGIAYATLAGILNMEASMGRAADDGSLEFARARLGLAEARSALTAWLAKRERSKE